MNTKHFFKMTLPVTVAIFASCSGDNLSNDTTVLQQETQGMTEFAVVENNIETSGAPQARTSGEYTGSSVKFYWTSNDQLWINNTAATPALKASSRSDIPDTGGKELTAKFWFEGTYTAPTYPVRYTGNGNNVGDKVTIKAAQAQQTPNDGAHIGTDGDCGTATATKGTDGKYNFTLDHKASYLTFVPYTTQDVISNAVITQIKVTANRPIAGTYNFDDSGLDTSAPTTASNSITLTLNGNSPTSGFAIPSAYNPATNAAIMVLAPGTYSTFTVEYTIYHAASNISGTIIKEYTNLTFVAGKNKKVAADLHVPEYGFHEYYMWDAAVGQHYWAGYESVQPANNNQSNSNYPKTVSDPRWYHTGTFPINASRSAANCPNVNEIYWYAQYGDPHWDADLLWTMNGVLSKGVMWFKKQSVIAADQSTTVSAMKAAAKNGIDYRTTAVDLVANAYSGVPVKSRPSRTPDYFFLPPLGHYNTGKLLYKNEWGLYWTSNVQYAPGLNRAYSLTFYKDRVFVNYNYSGRVLGLRLWTAQ